MLFKYEWTIKENATHAIRKRDTRQQKAGQEIEPKNKQTSKTHYFLFVDKNDTDSMYNRIKINAILKTISYEYVYKGTGKKAATHYLGKADIEKVFENIESYKGKVITIETTPPVNNQNIKNKIKDLIKMYEEVYGKEKMEKTYNLMLKRHNKKNGITTKRQEVKKQIAKLEKDLATYIRDTNAEIQVIEKIIIDNIGKKIDIPETETKKKVFFDILYRMAKTEEQRRKANTKQKDYRDRQNKKAEKSHAPD